MTDERDVNRRYHVNMGNPAPGFQDRAERALDDMFCGCLDIHPSHKRDLIAERDEMWADRITRLADEIRREQPERRTSAAHGRLEATTRFLDLLNGEPA